MTEKKKLKLSEGFTIIHFSYVVKSKSNAPIIIKIPLVIHPFSARLRVFLFCYYIK